MRRFTLARSLAERCAPVFVAVVQVCIVFTLLGVTEARADLLATFEDVSPTTTYVGPGGGLYWNGSDGSGGFTSGGLDFANNFNSTFGSWDSWAFSNTTDTTTPGFANQYSAFTGGGVNGSAQYGVFFQPFSNGPTITPAGGGTATFAGGFFTNTTYAALSLQNGDAFAKKFGGPSGNDPDWFLLTVAGLDSGGGQTGAVELYLADYRFADNSQDFIRDEWTWLDLSSLGEVAALQFSLTSSDVGAFGMNTPAYFALDNLTGLSSVPEPTSVLLWGVGAGTVCAFRCRRRRRSR
ncbi:MAG: DUF4465 domain-containing protein [Pirellulales bacterium]|nr:DUF4465 domain-containing protein [Pirellulales bacterium]